MRMGMVLPEWAEWIINPFSENSKRDSADAESLFFIQQMEQVLVPEA